MQIEITDTEQRWRAEANAEAVRRKVSQKNEPIEVPQSILDMTDQEYSEWYQKSLQTED
jgi:hypothetical protein